MANEISVSVILVEMEDGSYRATCPDLDMEEKGGGGDEAVDNLKSAIAKYIKEKGFENIQLNPVKCMKIKVPV